MKAMMFLKTKQNVRPKLVFTLETKLCPRLEEAVFKIVKKK